MLASGKSGYLPYTPATNLLYGLREALDMLFEEGLDNVFDRHQRHAEAARRAVRSHGCKSADSALHQDCIATCFAPPNPVALYTC